MTITIVDREPASQQTTFAAQNKRFWRTVRMNVRDISVELCVSIGSVEFIIYEHLQYSKITVRWIPKLLNFEQKLSLWEACHRLLTRYEAEGDGFFNPNLHYRWDMGKSEDIRSASKVICTVFWDRRGMLYVYFLRTQHTTNAAYYANLSKTNVKPAYRSKRRCQVRFSSKITRVLIPRVSRTIQYQNWGGRYWNTPLQSRFITLRLSHVWTTEGSPWRSKIQYRQRGRGVCAHMAIWVAQRILRYRPAPPPERWTKYVTCEREYLKNYKVL